MQFTDEATIPEADIANTVLGDGLLAAEHVRSSRDHDDGSDVDFLGDLNRIIDLNAEITNSALDFGMPKQELNCPEVAGSPVNQHCLSAPQRMRPELCRVEPDAR